jgi:hypothetical protein
VPATKLDEGVGLHWEILRQGVSSSPISREIFWHIMHIPYRPPFVYPVEDVVRIRTGERDHEALMYPDDIDARQTKT